MAETDESDDFTGFERPADPAQSPSRNASRVVTVSGTARDVRQRTEELGSGPTRQLIQVLTFFVEEYDQSGRTAPVFAEQRGQTLGRIPRDGEPITVSGRYYDDCLHVRSLASGERHPGLSSRRAPLWITHGPKARTAAVWLAIAAGVVTVILAANGRGPAAGVGPFQGPPTRSPAPAPTQIVAKAAGKGPWTVRGYGYEFSVVSITPAVGPFGPNEGQRCLRVVATIERYEDDDHRAMQLVVIDDRGRILGLDPFSGKGTMDPPLHTRTQLEALAVLQAGGAARLTFNIRSHFWPDGKDLFLQDVPTGR